MTGKRGIIMGVANKDSIGWHISRHLAENGAELAFTYQNDALAKRVIPLGESIGSTIFQQCDVSHDEDSRNAFSEISKIWPSVDFVLHAVAFANKEELKGEYFNASRENFLQAMDISCYSFTRLCALSKDMMPNGGSILTLSYYGAEKVMPHYNLMGVAKAALEASVKYLAMDLGKYNIRVNALSAGPMKTLAASAIGDFRYILKWNQYNSPLRRNVNGDDVGKAGLYLLSDLSSGVSGEIHHVDCGYNVVGMKAVDAPDINTQL